MQANKLHHRNVAKSYSG